MNIYEQAKQNPAIHGFVSNDINIILILFFFVGLQLTFIRLIVQVQVNYQNIFMSVIK